MTTIFNPRKMSDMSADIVNYRGTGIRFSATANTTTTYDYLLTEDRILTGAEGLVNGASWGDKVTLQVVDKDNVLGFGANTVLNQFVTDWNICTDQQRQNTPNAIYPAKLLAGVYVRVLYTSVALLTGPSVAINFHMHKVLL